MTDERFRPIASRLIRSIYIGAAACALVVGGIVSAFTYRETQQEFEQALQDVARSNLPLLSVVVWDIEPAAIQRQLDAIALRPEIGAVRLQVKTGQRFQAGEAKLLQDHGLRGFDVSAPTNPSLAIAHLDIAADPGALRRAVLQHVLGILTGLLLLTTVVCALVAHLLRRDLERPLRHIARFASELTPARLTQPLVLAGAGRTHRDEIDLVVSGFHTLQEGVRSHIDQLDQQVAERTRELERALASIRRMSTLDPLTGCFNRALFNERAPQELERAERYARPLSIIFIDLDHFKAINDSNGHLTGDEVLRTAAQRCLGSLRQQIDWVARFGGEEFVVVLPETALVDAQRLAERLRRAIGEPVLLHDGRHLHVSASFGVAEHLPGEALPPLLERADQQLFAAKSAGRNRVMPVLS